MVTEHPSSVPSTHRKLWYQLWPQQALGARVVYTKTLPMLTEITVKELWARVSAVLSSISHVLSAHTKVP